MLLLRDGSEIDCLTGSGRKKLKCIFKEYSKKTKQELYLWGSISLHNNASEP
jgi:hypothetical protein